MKSFAAPAMALALVSVSLQSRAQDVSLDPASMPRIATVDARFYSYNIEMAEVTGEASGNHTKVRPRGNGSQAISTAVGLRSGRHGPEPVSTPSPPNRPLESPFAQAGCVRSARRTCGSAEPVGELDVLRRFRHFADETASGLQQCSDADRNGKAWSTLRMQ